MGKFLRTSLNFVVMAGADLRKARPANPTAASPRPTTIAEDA